MKILGIETSCDETSASIVEDGWKILSNVVSSSLKDHQKYGGIIPEIASRRQIELIQPVVRQAMEEAEVKWNSIDAVGVTKSPGLIGSLLVGVSFARALAFALKKPLIEVDHIQAHLYANFLRFKFSRHSEAERPKNLPGPPFTRTGVGKTRRSFASLRMTEKEFPTLPAIGLVVSGGHSSLFHVKSFNHCILLGQTRDDAAGEAYDKVARILGLGYPGGPIIDRLAKEGISKQIRFPCADLPDTFDFSFSGVKTAVLYHLKKNKAPDESSVKRIAHAFQESIVSVLVEKSITACKKKKLKTLLIGGGVAANSALRQRLQWRGREEQIKVFFPSVPLCIDNAAMIAGLAYHLRESKKF